MPEKSGLHTSAGVSSDAPAVDRPQSREQSDELLRKARAGMAEVASRMTRERQVQLMDSHMQMRDAGYRQLFSSWNLDETTVTKTLTIIRDREARLLEKKLHHMKEGPSYTSTFLKEQKLERELAEMELVILLGQERFNELTSREAEMDAEVQAQAREIMEARKR
ncbi:hypothetical protein [Roseimicrobium gellanilyticum]|nr:hypothetical protein [Roseimicrobium gellanilyticum]